jgi:hypothetical protein
VPSPSTSRARHVSSAASGWAIGGSTRIPDPAAGVWELGIIDFERRAWIEGVLANRAGPDLERYLSRELYAEI